MTVTFTKLTSAELVQVIDDPEQIRGIIWRPLPGAGPSGSVDKAIDGIQFLLSAADVPINLAPERMPGEPIPTQDGEIYFGLSADQVATIAAQLAATRFDTLARHFSPERMNQEGVQPTPWAAEDLDYLEENYQILVSFFVDASKGGGAALLSCD
ncbi:hypothetical protein B8W69_28490 [Mycobacterium vulneris]|uniref:DUF1877 domain-containing protein n=1 Tax=Mycolicibacterium vulneris TaxID=547163 RepID=A0A1X2KIS5_9MYCO|nr:DUF1877 family protein [Mycolicibacterium vulneris]OSC21542.1 hypothetical protein B8W69_28490 [Mycolicibacterium vulneris]